MAGISAEADAALAPLRRALRDEADREAAQIASAGQAEAARIIDQAKAEAAAITRDATARGEAEAAADARLRSSHTRRAARQAVLSAQEQLRLDFIERLRVHALAARTDPRYGALLERLRGEAQQALGPGAQISEAPDGGLLARNGSRRLDLSLPAIARLTAAEMTHEVAALWED